MNLRDLAVLDYESLPSRGRPISSPPPPVGVAVRIPGKPTKYYSFGHPTGNRSTWAEARRAVGEVYDSGRPIGYHNAKFDVDVTETHMDLPRLPWGRYHDTQPMLFLKDPRATNFQLKANAETLLGEEPEERDAVIDWLLEHQPVAGVTLSKSRESEYYVGAYVAWAPEPLVAKYAIGDVNRTHGLAQVVSQEIETRGMLDAYDRERRILPATLEMERQGIRVDVDSLETDVARYSHALDSLDQWLRKTLKCPGLNCDSGAELIDALIAAGFTTEAVVGRTKTGKLKHDKETLANAVKHPQLLAVLRYRAQLCTCLRTFMMPWLHTATLSGGFIYTTWNSIRQDRGDGQVGARTGRYSSTPNFQNLPKQFASLFREHATAHEAKGQDITLEELRAKLSKLPFFLPPLPQCRAYLIPYAPGHILIDRDYSQQELRILAHYEAGALLAAYKANVWLDVHEHAQKLINELLNAHFARKPIKNTGFGLIYGMGLGKLAAKSNTSVEMAKKVRDAYLAIFPGLKEMYRDMKYRAASNKPIRTWGGREYFCEEPKLIDGRIRQFDYKLLNVLIQGSAADCTKEALIRYHAAKGSDVRVYLTAHDELLASVPEDGLKKHMKVMKDVMESIEFDVPMLSEGAIGKTWATLHDYDKAGKLLAA